MPLYDYVCEECKREFETTSSIGRRNFVRCPWCKGPSHVVIRNIRRHVVFPEGVFHGLPDEPYITSRRQLREEVKKASKDEFTACESVYDDGYGGF